MKKHLYDSIASRWLNKTTSVFVLSDPHFGDLEAYRYRHLIKIPDKKDYFNTFKDGDVFETYETHISKLVKKADEEFIKKINSICGKDATLVILGDIGDIECVKKLKAGYKVLLLGNHDKGASNYKKEYWFTMNDGSPLHFEDKNTEKRVISGDLNIVNIKTSNNGLFDEVYEGPLMINDRVILSHEPIDVPEYMFNIHGHTHKLSYKYDDRHLNMCAEAIDYKPVNMLKLMQDGILKNTKSIHTITVADATKRKQKRNLKNIDKMLEEIKK